MVSVLSGSLRRSHIMLMWGSARSQGTWSPKPSEATSVCVLEQVVHLSMPQFLFLAGARSCQKKSVSKIHSGITDHLLVKKRIISLGVLHQMLPRKKENDTALGTKMHTRRDRLGRGWVGGRKERLAAGEEAACRSPSVTEDHLCLHLAPI